MYRLEHKIKSMNQVGLATARQLARLGIETVYDLLYFFPFRYEEYTQAGSISELVPEQHVTIDVEVEMIAARMTKNKRMKMTEAIVTDGKDSLKVVWFNQPYIAKNIKSGDAITLTGKVSVNQFGTQITNPSYAKSIRAKQHVVSEGMQPVYHLSGNLQQKQIRHLTKQAVGSCEQLVEWLPSHIKTQQKLMDIGQAIQEIHYPTSETLLQKALHRLRFEELFLLLLQAGRIKQLIADQIAVGQTYKETEVQEFVQNLNFTLTDDQKKSTWRILQDLQKNQPMNRLLEGDVGSGKTVVAAIALYHTVLNRQQGVVLAPTSILASQHYETFRNFFDEYGFRVGIFTQGIKMINDEKVSKDQMLDALQSGEVDIVIGTHALLSDTVYYHNIGLAVIDEQHRFGVSQRKTLKEKNLSHTMPHLLSMTATPIPRSLSLIMYGDLDVSILKEKPKGRKPITTQVVLESKRKAAYAFIEKEIKQGRQVFVICPLIDPSDTLGVKSVTEEYKKLNEEVFPKLEIGLLHGKLKSKEKEEIMHRFQNNEFPILVSTSVIEVGIDVPNATIMMIEGAERFGLAQLHQFRGRVGRSELQSYCFIFPSGTTGEQTKQRLEALEKTNDGFKLAEYDLQVRGPGEIYGTRQSGLPELKIAEITNLALVSEVKEVVEEYLEHNNLEDFPLLYERVKSKAENVHLE